MRTEKYTEQVKRLPLTGRQIIGSKEEDNIIVYQAFNPAIAAYAVAHQQLGGEQYSFNRMSWIKPGFLWMMHRAGWATKQSQECILALTVPLHHFKTILGMATISSYDSGLFASQEAWQNELAKTEVRLQWDPDHDPFGQKQERKAIQLGMKGETLRLFCTQWIKRIEDITAFVKDEHKNVQENKIDDLTVPLETVIDIEDTVIEKRIGIQK